jgi:hypothetical protein
MVPLVVFALYWPYRMGAQIIGGLDHNSTVNAGAQLRRCNAGALARLRCGLLRRGCSLEPVTPEGPVTLCSGMTPAQEPAK